MPIVTTASFRVRPDALERCEAAVAAFVTRILTEEPGTRLYLSLQDGAERTRFLHVMVFDDERAEERHRHSAATTEFARFLHPELLGGIDLHDYRVVAGVGVPSGA